MISRKAQNLVLLFFPARSFITLVMAATLAACNSSSEFSGNESAAIESNPDSAEELILAAEASDGEEADALLLQAAGVLIEDDQISRADSLLNRIDEDELSEALLAQFELRQAQLALAESRADDALFWLEPARIMADLPMTLNREYIMTLAEALVATGQTATAIDIYTQLSDGEELPDTIITTMIWQLLDNLDDDELAALATNADTYELRGWIELTHSLRNNQFSMRSQLDALAQWRRVWSRHSAVNAMPDSIRNLEQAWESRPRHIALILPLQSAAGKAIEEGFLSAYYQAMESTREVPRLTVIDSSNASSVYSLYDEAVDSGAELIIGPLDKELVNQLQQLRELPVPTLALNYTDTIDAANNQLYQFGLAPEDEISQAIELAWNAGHRNAALLTPASQDYERLQSIFANMWLARGGTVVARTNFDNNSDYSEVIKRLLAIDSSEVRRDRLLSIVPRNNVFFTPRRRQDVDFIFLIANPLQGRQIKPTLAFYFAQNLPVYSLPSINDGLDNPDANRDLDGIIFTDAPWLFDKSSELKIHTITSLRRTQGALQRLRAMGIDSFQLYTRLQQLAAGEVSSLRGATGQLTMSNNLRIRRQLEAAQFSNGEAIRANSAAPNIN